MTKQTAVKLDETLHTRLQQLGEKADRSPHWLMKTAIEQYVHQQEQYWQEREEDAARWQQYQLTGEAIAQADVDTWLASIGTEDELPCPATPSH